jgi:hypothetical protein
MSIYDEGSLAEQKVRRPNVTAAEEHLFSTDMAPVVRLAGNAVVELRSALKLLADMVNESRANRTDGAELPLWAKEWLGAFSALSEPHDRLMDAYREVAKIAMDQAEAQTANPRVGDGRVGFVLSLDS